MCYSNSKIGGGVGEVLELVEADQGHYGKDLVKKLRKAQKSVKLILSADPGMKEEFDAFLIGGLGGCCVEGINPMGSDCSPERFWGEVDSWIKAVWNGDEEEVVVVKSQLGKKSAHAGTPLFSSANKVGPRTAKPPRPLVRSGWVRAGRE